MPTIPFLFFHEPAAALSHLLAVPAAAYGGWRLVQRARGDARKVAASVLYAACFVWLFCISGSYHSCAPGPWREFFHRLDFMAIWLAIAASATPILLLLLRGFWRWSMLATFWAWMLTSLVILDRWHAGLPYWAIIALYLASSVVSAVSLWRLHRRFPVKTLAVLWAGCLLYVAGALVDYAQAPVLIPGVIGAHEVFHLLVVAAASCHYAFIYGWMELRLPKPRPASGAAPRPAVGGFAPAANLS